jgi:cell division transport system permease protein
MRRKARLIPDDEGAGRFLPWVVAVMAYLATLATVGMLMLNLAMQTWQSGLAGNLTIEIPPLEAAGEPTPTRAEQVLAALAKMDGVKSARLVGERELAALLAPWLGPDTPVDELPVPQLIDVALDLERAPAADEIGRRLRPLAPGLRVDDHQQWLNHLIRLGFGVQVVAALTITLIALAMATVVVFAVRAALAAHDRVVALLHIMGARDAFIARQFQLHAFLMGLKGGCIGLALAALTLFVLSRLALHIELPFLPPLRPSTRMLGVLALVPPACGLIAFVTARLTVLKRLGRMP